MSNLAEAIKGLKYDSAGLIPAIVVDHKTKQVLMMAWMNSASLQDTITKGKTHFWSRSRQKYWMKGEESGHTQDVKAVLVDCDMDCLVIEVEQHGAACHEGYWTCFFRQLTPDGQFVTLGKPMVDPKTVYKNKK